MKLEDWICDVKATIRSRPLSEEDKVDFVFQHLTGPAREEVKFRPRKSVEDVFSILREVFGDQGSSVHFQRSFFERKQKEGENIRDFSHALLDLFDRACRKSPHLISHKEQVLCDQFADRVSDSLLRTNLRKRVKDTPTIELFTLRSEAIDWADELTNTPFTKPKANIQSSPTEVFTLRSEAINWTDELNTQQKATIQAARTSLMAETRALTDIIHKQQQQIEQQQKQIEQVTNLVHEHITKQDLNKNTETFTNRRDKSRTRMK